MSTGEKALGIRGSKISKIDKNAKFFQIRTCVLMERVRICFFGENWDFIID
jgi:hypothetical protein